MPFIYPAANTLRGPKIGGGDCVALVRFHANVPQHAAWKEGERVLDNPNMRAGTAIATFVKGRYPSLAKGNHAAFFLRHGAPGTGFWVIDQWKDKPHQKKRDIESRFIRAYRVKQNQDGTWPGASDNADAFSVIELR